MQDGAQDADHDQSNADALADALFGDDEANNQSATKSLEGQFPASDTAPVPNDEVEDHVEPVAADEREEVAADDDDDDLGDDLFGDAADEEDAEDNGMEQDEGEEEDVGLPDLPMEMDEDFEGLTSAEIARRQALEYEEGDEPALELPPQELQTAQIDLANYRIPKGGKVWHARLPNFLSLETKAFERESWQGDEADLVTDKNGEERERAPVPDENVIRWKWTKDELNQAVKESNARIVRWNDGTLSLQLGAELFDMSLAVDHSAILSSTTQSTVPVVPAGLTTSLSSFDSNRSHGLTYLTSYHAYAGLIEAQASIHGTLTFRPTTLQSAAHRRLAGNVKARNVKVSRTKLASVPQFDPERQKQERERIELEKVKQLKKEEKKLQGGSRTSGGRYKKPKALTRLEMGSDEEGEGNSMGLGDSDEEDDGFGLYASGPRARAGALRDEYDEDDEDFVRPDAEGSEPEIEADSGELDEVEQAEARIEEQQREEKRRNKSGADSEPTDPIPAPKRRLVVDDSDEE